MLQKHFALRYYYSSCLFFSMLYLFWYTFGTGCMIYWTWE